MRDLQSIELQTGKIDIAKIKFDPKSRDDIPQILKGLQYIYIKENIPQEVFNLLEQYIAPTISKNTGRPGMELWKTLVTGVLTYIKRFEGSIM